MEFNAEELSRINEALKELLDDADLEEVPMFRCGSKLVRKIKMEARFILRRRIAANLRHQLRKLDRVFKNMLGLYLTILMRLRYRRRELILHGMRRLGLRSKHEERRKIATAM